MPWAGYNEDAIIISEKLIKNDVFTSIHIEEFRAAGPRHEAWCRGNHARNPERVRGSVKNLDEEGVIRIGARVRRGDILVGKVTPKGEQELSPEERLLKAIFGDKAGDVRDASLKAPPGMDGIVIDIKVFSRRGRTRARRRRRRRRSRSLVVTQKNERERIADVRLGTVKQILDGQLVNVLKSASTGEPLARKGHKYAEDFPREHRSRRPRVGRRSPKTKKVNESSGRRWTAPSRRSRAAKSSTNREGHAWRRTAAGRGQARERSTSPKSANCRSATRWPPPRQQGVSSAHRARKTRHPCRPATRPRSSSIRSACLRA